MFELWEPILYPHVTCILKQSFMFKVLCDVLDYLNAYMYFKTAFIF